MTTKKIAGDHSRFKKIIAGKLNERMSKYIRTGHIFKMRPNGKGNMSIPVPQIDQPRFRYGKMTEGSGRGPGKPGDTVDKDYEPGHGPGGGQGDGDAILVSRWQQGAGLPWLACDHGAALGGARLGY